MSNPTPTLTDLLDEVDPWTSWSARIDAEHYKSGIPVPTRRRESQTVEVDVHGRTARVTVRRYDTRKSGVVFVRTEDTNGEYVNAWTVENGVPASPTMGDYGVTSPARGVNDEYDAAWDRHNRAGMRHDRGVVADVLAALGATVTKTRFDRKAGCSMCPCSPGVRVDVDGLDADAFRGVAVYVTVVVPAAAPTRTFTYADFDVA